jgi:hypothetical protein
MGDHEQIAVEGAISAPISVAVYYTATDQIKAKRSSWVGKRFSD